MWASFFVLLHTTASLALIARVLIRPRLDPSVRLAWIMVIETLPFVGMGAYLLFGEVRMNRAEVQRMRDVRDRLTGRLERLSDPVAVLPDFEKPIVATNEAVGGMAPLGGNRITLLDESDSAIDQMVEAIDAARDHVHIVFYIWLADHSGTKVAEAVMRAALRGVACRIIVDALGSRALTRSELWSRMKGAGAECVTAFPWGVPFVSMLFQRLDLRNHRKVLVIDNRLAFTGSRNCSDKAFAVKPRYAPWIDVLFLVEGPAVRHLQAVFLGDWISYTGTDLGAMLTPVPVVESPGQPVQVVATGPDRRAGTISDCLTAMLHAARDRVVITTPYYVPDIALDSAIRAAARRGVEVVMILPARNDSLIVGATSQGFYHDLLSAGVRIMLFQEGLLHAKIMTVDHEMAMIGSANLDRRSFELNYEVNMTLFDDDMVVALHQRQQTYIDRAREITLDEVRGWSRLRRMRNNLLALASPLL